MSKEKLLEYHKLKKSKRVQKISSGEEKYDYKYAYHIFRLASEAEQILSGGDLDLRRDRELLKSVRRGEWTEEQARVWFADKEKQLDLLFAKCTLPDHAPEGKLRKLLLECLEMHYGKITHEVITKVDSMEVLYQIHELTRKAIGV